MKRWPKDLTGVNVNGVYPIAKVEDIIRPSGNKEAWLCKCPFFENNFTATRNDIVTGHTKSCGCINHNNKIYDLSGMRFGFLTVIKLDHIHVSPSGQKTPYWLCKCDCEKTVIVN